MEHRLITRRQFITGAFGTAVAVVGGAVLLEGCSSSSGSGGVLSSVGAAFPNANVVQLQASDSQIVQASALNQVDSGTYASLTSTYSLPYGSLVYQDSSNYVLALVPTTTGPVLTQVALMSLYTGQTTTVLASPKTTQDGNVIYDARASDNAIIWVECALLTGTWNVYAATLDGVTLGSTVQLDSGDGNYDPPMIAISASNVYWTVMPTATGNASSTDSVLKAVDMSASGASASNARIVYTSHGRMLTNPQASDNYITIVPRVDTKTTLYQLTAISVGDDKVHEIAILPASLQVSEAVYMLGAGSGGGSGSATSQSAAAQGAGGSFVFSVASNYTDVDGIGNYGTYDQLNGGNYLYTNKAPVGPAVMFGNCIDMRATKTVIGLDNSAGAYYSIDNPDNVSAAGDFLAGAGTQKRLVIYSPIVDQVNNTSGVQVRVYDAV
ncbi:MAG: hypothetical protein LBM21_02675 [Coriobacteriales bacterium]|jgi:hypothetical protein|nr:hypothetical protein [Coriobacteriales bacterium]